MPIQFRKGLAVGVVVLMISGCTGGQEVVRTRSYVMDKEREDQKMEGNFGYLMGNPVPEDRSAYRKTRKLYVFEVTREPIEDEAEGQAGVQSTPPAAPSLRRPARKSASASTSRTGPLVLPSFDDDYPGEASSGKTITEHAFVDYEVKKNDTLQKISKKFYDSYRLWPRIYEENKDIIGDPDSITPGVVLRIPIDY